MLECDYSDQLQRLITETQFQIELPETMHSFFSDSSPMPTSSDDTRRSARVRVRAQTVMFSEGYLSPLPRPPRPIGIYLADISKYGVGFITSEQYFPCERLRLLLPSFWLSIEVVRAQRIGPHCLHTGATIAKRHPPSAEAFELNPRSLSELVPA